MTGHVDVTGANADHQQQAWRALLLQGQGQQRASVPIAPVGESSDALDLLFRTVKRRGLRLNEPPAGWPPLQSPAGLIRLKAANCAVMGASAGQEQLDHLKHVPRTPALVGLALRAGLPLADQAFFDGGLPVVLTREAFWQEFDYARTKAAAFCLVARSRQLGALREYKDFVAHLEAEGGIRRERLGESERVILLKIAFVSLERALTEHRSLPALVEWASRAWSELGSSIWHYIFRLSEVQRGQTVAELTHLCEAVTQEVAEAGSAKFVRSLASTKQLTEHGLQALAQRRTQRWQDRAAQRPLEDVIAAFAQPSGVSAVSLPANLLAYCADAYRRIEQRREELQVTSTPTLKAEIAGQSHLARLAQADPVALRAAQEQLVALACESVRRFFKIIPYSTQVITVLALLSQKTNDRGALAQVNTGEGKSTIVTVLALVQAASGRKVDVVSSSRPLAVRDQCKYELLFASWDLRTGHLCSDRLADHRFGVDVLYGTNHDFEFSLLRQDMGHYDGVGLRVEDSRRARPHDLVIVDEVDSLFIDQSGSRAIIATDRDDPHRWVVQPLLRAVGSWLPDRWPHDVCVAARHALATMDEGAYAEKSAGLTDNALASWAQSARWALEDASEGVNYVVLTATEIRHRLEADGQDISQVDRRFSGGRSVIIVDGNTGQLLPASRWQNRRHQFVEAKHELILRDDHPAVAEMSHSVFFAQYQQILGVSGTMGDRAERDEVKEVFDVETFDVPPFLPNDRRDLPPLLFNGPQAWVRGVVAEVREMTTAGRPCLILTENIKESQDLTTHLQSEGIEFQLLNAVQNEDEELIVARAGRPGMVTVATNVAGRGTDILLPQASRQAGGLHVIMAFLADNLRIEQQGIGRAARQGQPGSSRIMIDRSTVAPLAKPDEALASMGDMQAIRSRVLLESSQHRRIQASISKCLHEKVADFFLHFRRWQAEVSPAFLAAEADYAFGRLSQRALPLNTPNWSTASMEETEQGVQAANRLDPVSIQRSAMSQEHLRAMCAAWMNQLKKDVERNLLSCWADILARLHEVSGSITVSLPLFGKTGLEDLLDAIYDGQAPAMAQYFSAPTVQFRDHLDQQLTRI